MAGNSIATGFVSLGNIVSEVLYAIDDFEKKKYMALALQRVINAIRDVNVNMSSFYDEVDVTLDEDLRTGDYPTGLVKALAVGVYRNGEFWSFTKKPEMAKTMTNGDETPDTDFGEDSNIPARGYRFGARGVNFGYWTPDDKNCRFIVRNYTGSKVILRFRSNGITCTTQSCIPYPAKDLIVNMVVYEFMISGRPRKFTGAEINARLMERTRHYDQYTDIHYLPQNFDEMKDAEFASLNTTVRRG